MIDEEEMLLMNNIKTYISGLIKAADIHEFNKVNKDKLVFFEFVRCLKYYQFSLSPIVD